MKEIHDINTLKKLAKQAEMRRAKTNNQHYLLAYSQIAAGCGLLWRLLDQGTDDGRGQLVKK